MYAAVKSPMPNLSELLRGGLNFTNAFCTNANTGPSTASFLTGRHPHKNNLLHNGDKFSGTHATVAKILQKVSMAPVVKCHRTVRDALRQASMAF